MYGTYKQKEEYKDFAYGGYINVYDLILEYRKKVNPKVNVFSVQTAGYNDVCVPEQSYRTNILYGWTGKELNYAVKMNELWDEVENKNKN